MNRFSGEIHTFCIIISLLPELETLWKYRCIDDIPIFLIPKTGLWGTVGYLTPINGAIRNLIWSKRNRLGTAEKCARLIDSVF